MGDNDTWKVFVSIKLYDTRKHLLQFLEYCRHSININFPSFLFQIIILAHSLHAFNFRSPSFQNALHTRLCKNAPL